MDTTTLLIVIAVLVLIVLVLLSAGLAQRRNRTEALRRQFGPEYDQAVTEAGDQRKAESELAARQKRVASLSIRPLPAEERDRYATAWRAVQTRFVDEPNRAIVEADRLVTAVMEARGYPMADFEQRVADLSVDHAQVVTHYRAAREIAQTNEGGQASTETLRQGMIHYRALFEDLLAASTAPEQKELAA